MLSSQQKKNYLGLDLAMPHSNYSWASPLEPLKFGTAQKHYTKKTVHGQGFRITWYIKQGRCDIKKIMSAWNYDNKFYNKK